MKRAELFHPRVFDDQQFADGYYKRNAGYIEKLGKRFAGLLKKNGFEGGKVFDSGCGFGSVAIELARAFPEVEIIGIDLSEPILSLGKTLIEKAGFTDRITLLKGDVTRIDFPDHSFDLVLNTYMVHVVDQPVVMFNEIERIARPQAKIMISDLRRIWLGVLVKKLKTAYSLEEAAEVIKQSNLRPGTLSKGFFWWDYMAGIQ